MNVQELTKTAQAIVAEDRGLIAMDESVATCNKRFAALNIPQTVEMRRAYRELIVTTPGMGQYLNGAILFDETMRQETKDGRSFVKLLADAGVIPGIKVDLGAHDLAFFPGEKVTDGLDGLRGRLREYREMGARFAKWRAVITPGDAIPTSGCIAMNAHALARYAALCQDEDIVPIVEPEVLMDGSHTMARCKDITEATLRVVFAELEAQRVVLEGMILKPNMVLPGLACANQEDAGKIADATIEAFLRTVPAAVPGIAFLSGGQGAELASERLSAMNARYKGRAPWGLSFSYSRAIQQPALELWAGQDANIAAAQKVLLHRLRCNAAARRGEYTAALEAAA